MMRRTDKNGAMNSLSFIFVRLFVFFGIASLSRVFSVNEMEREREGSVCGAGIDRDGIEGEKRTVSRLPRRRGTNRPQRCEAKKRKAGNLATRL